MRESAVTIRDIAQDLGISHATVSRALAGHPKISDTTKERVREAAARLRYVVNASARTLRSAHSKLVGLVIPDIQNDFYASVAKRLADRLEARGFQLALSVTEDDAQRELRDVRALLEARAAGVIITPSMDLRRETAAMLQHVRTIQLIRRHRSLRTAAAVVIDDRAGVHQATRHLIDLGHTRIGYLGTHTRLSSGRNRLAGFVRAMREAALAADRVLLGPPRPEFARQAIGSWLGTSAATGWVSGSSELTLGALQALHHAGLRLPADLSLIGYGDPAWFTLVGPGITTVGLPVAEAAEAAASMVLADGRCDLAGTKVGGALTRLTPVFVPRGSAARCPGSAGR